MSSFTGLIFPPLILLWFLSTNDSESVQSGSNTLPVDLKVTTSHVLHGICGLNHLPSMIGGNINCSRCSASWAVDISSSHLGRHDLFLSGQPPSGCTKHNTSSPVPFSPLFKCHPSARRAPTFAFIFWFKENLINGNHTRTHVWDTSQVLVLNFGMNSRGVEHTGGYGKFHLICGSNATNHMYERALTNCIGKVMLTSVGRRQQRRVAIAPQLVIWLSRACVCR